MSDERYGVLVGWTSQEVGSRLMLNIQSVESMERAAPDDASVSHLMMTRNQAILLGNYLFQVTRQQPPRKKRTWLQRLVGA